MADVSGGVVPWLWEQKDWIADRMRDLWRWFKGKSDEQQTRGILILGPGGVGKTTLARLLSGEFDLMVDASKPYKESIGVERYALDEAPGVEIVVPPGQRHRRKSTWTRLLSEVAGGRFRGIVLMGAYGFNSLGRIRYRKHQLYNGSKTDFLRAYLDDQREEEIRVLRQLVPYVQVAKGKLWLLSTVVKQDLWWAKRNQVETHYREQVYGRELDRLTESRSSESLRHEYAFASLVISNFETGLQERLAANAAGYDHRLQVESLRRLFETIDSLKSWEEEP